MNQILTRREVDLRFTWNAPSVFPSVEAWEEELSSIQEILPTLAAFAGRLGESPAVLADALETYQAVMRRTGIVLTYASMSQNVDTTDQVAARMLGQAQGLLSQATAAASFLDPELLALTRDKLDRWLAEEPRLRIYGHYIDDLYRQRAHVRSPEVEALLGLVVDPFAGTFRSFSALTNADMAFPPVKGSNGEALPLTQGTWMEILSGTDRTARRGAWNNYLDTYAAFKNTLANNLLTGARQRVFLMRSRRHESTLEASLFRFNIPVQVFHNLIDTFRKHLPVWQRYWEVRRRALGVETLSPYDLWAPLTAERPSVPYQQAVQWICDALAPLGTEYVDAVRRGCVEERWIDLYPTPGKASGAFSSGSPGTYPFILMNYVDDVVSLGTLAHELGHSMHSFLTWQHQPMVYARYSTFVAEVASNFHQAMLRAHLFEHEEDPTLQLALIQEAMVNFHRYFLVMPTLARFELEVYRRLETGKGITADGMIDLMADLFSEAYEGLSFDRQRVGIWWATFPHLYMNYYVFQYATGIAGAHALANRVRSAQPDAVEDYLAFLKTGNARYPLDALRLAGVDLASPEPVEEAFGVLSQLIDRLEQLLPYTA